MESMDQIRALQQIELGILLDVDAFCSQHNIVYFLGEGTLLGAIRHHGFIPWDDDVDILMKREDYERFLCLAKTGLSPRYEVQHCSTVENYWSPIMKVRLLEHTHGYAQQHIAHLSQHNGPYIDIFPMEYVPCASSFRQRIQSLQIRILRGMLSLKLGLFQPQGAVQHLVRMLSFFFSTAAIHRMLNRTFQRFGSCKTDFIATLSSYHRYSAQTLPSSVFDKQLRMPFEGHHLPVPDGYDLLLTTIYGDYMTPPPKQERMGKHHF